MSRWISWVATKWEWIAALALIATGLALLARQPATTTSPPPSTNAAVTPSPASEPLRDSPLDLADGVDYAWVLPLVDRFRDELSSGSYQLWRDPGPHVLDTLEDWRPRGVVTANFSPVYALDTGLVGRIIVTGHQPRPFWISPVFLKGPADPQLWTSMPPTAFTGVTTTAAKVTARIDPDRKWMTVDAELTLRNAGSPAALFDIPVLRGLTEAFDRRFPGNDALPGGRGFALRELTVDGVRPKFAQVVDDLAVNLDRRGRLVHFRYEGMPNDAGSSFVDDRLYLRGWIPISKGSTPPLELTLTVPSSHEVIGLGAPTASAERDGWITATWQLPAGASRGAMMIAPRAAIAAQTIALQVPGMQVRLIAERADIAERAEELRANVEQALTAARPLALPMPVTPATPAAPLDVVIGREDVVGEHALFLDRNADATLVPSLLRARVAAALIGRGYVLRVGDGCDAAASIASILAMYLAWTTLAPEDRALLKGRFATAEQESIRFPLTTPLVDCDGTSSAISARAVRLLITLGERIGEPALKDALLALAVPGQRLTWKRVSEQLGAKAGKEASQWLERWLAVTELPPFSLHFDGHQALELTSAEPAARGEKVVIAFYRGEAELGRATAEIEEDAKTQLLRMLREGRDSEAVDADETARAAKRPRLPAGTDRVVVDPDLTSVLRFPSFDATTPSHTYSAKLEPR